MSDGTPQDVLGKIFRVFDVNSDGTITQKEMQRLVADLFGLIQIQHKDQNQANHKIHQSDEFLTVCYHSGEQGEDCRKSLQ